MPRTKGEGLSNRYTDALRKIVLASPERFRGTDLDFEASRRTMEQLCARVEAALSTVESRPREGASPAAILALQLREALASNTIGGNADSEAKWRAATAEVKESQTSRRRLGSPGDAAGEALTVQFDAVVRKFYALRPVQEQRAPEPRRRR